MSSKGVVSFKVSTYMTTSSRFTCCSVTARRLLLPHRGLRGVCAGTNVQLRYMPQPTTPQRFCSSLGGQSVTTELPCKLLQATPAVLQGFSAADLPSVEVTSNKAGRAALARASAARFFELRHEVSPATQCITAAMYAVAYFLKFAVGP